MCVTTRQYEISRKNSHLLSQKVFLWSIIYPSEKTIHWNKQHFGMRYRPPLFLHYVSTIKHYWSIKHCLLLLLFFNLIFALLLFLFISHFWKKLSMDPVHDRGSMDPVQSGDPWTPGPCFVLTPCKKAMARQNTRRSPARPENYCESKQTHFSYSLDKAFHLPEFKAKLFFTWNWVGGFYWDRLLNCTKCVSHRGICIGNEFSRHGLHPSIFSGPASIEGESGGSGIPIYPLLSS